MTRRSRIRMALAGATAICFTAFTLLVAGAPGAQAAGDRTDCDLPAWTHVLTGHWGGGDCR